MAGGLEAIGWGPDRGFDQAMRGLLRLSFVVTRFIQNGRLDIYLTVTFIDGRAGHAAADVHLWRIAVDAGDAASPAA